MARQKARKPVFRNSKSSFPFLHLPAELRLRIYHFVLPHSLQISFDRGIYTWYRPRLPWRVRAKDDEGKCCFGVDATTSLFRVNKFVSNEAKAVLYGENEFLFDIDGQGGSPHWPIMRKIFGPLGEPDRLDVLRNLRKVELVLRLSRADRWAHRRHCARLQHFAEALGGKDGADSGMLKHLKVRFDSQVRYVCGCRAKTIYVKSTKYMYALESLTHLRGIEKAEVLGVDDWFAKCLEKAITGTGGEVQEIDYPYLVVKRKANGGQRKKRVTQTTRAWYQPKLNWDEFADRNGIKSSKDVEMQDAGAGPSRGKELPY
ncbi:hypothetical protein K469DRAFT_692793 [Zopfia rhizophila CBS 207.26]|uniref:F-box domain-containing protein n=1 Tax=Zopfia rhizophila CBS 207.26 TaxID=1314779 RepID=A0A6A6DQE7_9PEZI|nr:hypothetical protein K469DRAFT_692793 [Zopfia rhizophila CBS 207.26]